MGVLDSFSPFPSIASLKKTIRLINHLLCHPAPHRLYPATPTPPPSESPAPLRSHISGIYALAPFLGIAPESQPSAITVMAGRLIRLIKPE